VAPKTERRRREINCSGSQIPAPQQRKEIVELKHLETSKKTDTKKPKQPPLPTQLDSLGLIGAVALVIICLLSFLLPLPFFGGVEFFYEDFVVNCWKIIIQIFSVG
jgi:hypothetical protein